MMAILKHLNYYEEKKHSDQKYHSTFFVANILIEENIMLG